MSTHKGSFQIILQTTWAKKTEATSLGRNSTSLELFPGQLHVEILGLFSLSLSLHPAIYLSLLALP